MINKDYLIDFDFDLYIKNSASDVRPVIIIDEDTPNEMLKVVSLKRNRSVGDTKEYVYSICIKNDLIGKELSHNHGFIHFIMNKKGEIKLSGEESLPEGTVHKFRSALYISQKLRISLGYKGIEFNYVKLNKDFLKINSFWGEIRVYNKLDNTTYHLIKYSSDVNEFSLFQDPITLDTYSKFNIINVAANDCVFVLLIPTYIVDLFNDLEIVKVNGEDKILSV